MASCERVLNRHSVIVSIHSSCSLKCGSHDCVSVRQHCVTLRYIYIYIYKERERVKGEREGVGEEEGERHIGLTHSFSLGP